MCLCSLSIILDKVPVQNQILKAKSGLPSKQAVGLAIAGSQFLFEFLLLLGCINLKTVDR